MVDDCGKKWPTEIVYVGWNNVFLCTVFYKIFKIKKSSKQLEQKNWRNKTAAQNTGFCMGY